MKWARLVIVALVSLLVGVAGAIDSGDIAKYTVGRYLVRAALLDAADKKDWAFLNKIFYWSSGSFTNLTATRPIDKYSITFNSGDYGNYASEAIKGKYVNAYINAWAKSQAEYAKEITPVPRQPDHYKRLPMGGCITQEGKPVRFFGVYGTETKRSSFSYTLDGFDGPIQDENLEGGYYIAQWVKELCGNAPSLFRWSTIDDVRVSPQRLNANWLPDEAHLPAYVQLLVAQIDDVSTGYGPIPGVDIAGLTNASATCTPEICPALVAASTAPPGAGTGGTGGTGGAAACTKPDGTTSGNPYDCAPQDAELKCSILDIPCNLRKLFIPSSDWFKTKLTKRDLGFNVNLPVTIVNSWDLDVTIAGKQIKTGINFKGLEISEKGKDQYRFMMFWGTFLFLLSYIGVPFLGTRTHLANGARDDSIGAAAAEAAEAAASEARYRELRADDSWKNP